MISIMRPSTEKWGGVLEISLKEENSYWLISFKDTGVGMDKDTQLKMFDSFFTTKDKGAGTGLGLAMVFSIISQHRGSISVNSRRGEGTDIVLKIPQCEKNGSLTEAPEDSDRVFRGTGNILLVDDEKLIHDVTGRILRECGYSVLNAMNGTEALKIFKRKGTEIDLIILDLIMPGISGNEVCSGIKNIDPSAKILISTGFVNDERIDEKLRDLADGIINKPYTIVSLSRDIHHILSNPVT